MPDFIPSTFVLVDLFGQDMASSVTDVSIPTVGIDVRKHRECRNVNPIRTHAPNFMGRRGLIYI